MHTSSNLGKLIVFEGIDGSGKSTQSHRLAQWLRERGITCVESFEPTRGDWGMKVRQAAAQGERLPLEEEIECLLQDRREHVRNLIEPAVQRGEWVILDRYYLSMMAYQGATGYNVEQIREMNESFAPLPDIAFWLDIPLETALNRMEQRGRLLDAFEDESFLTACHSVYSSLDMPWWRRIPAIGTEEQIHQAIVDTLCKEFEIAKTHVDVKPSLTYRIISGKMSGRE